MPALDLKRVRSDRDLVRRGAGVQRDRVEVECCREWLAAPPKVTGGSSETREKGWQEGVKQSRFWEVSRADQARTGSGGLLCLRGDKRWQGNFLKGRMN